LIGSILTDSLEQPIWPEVPAIFSIYFGLNPGIVIGLTFLGSAIGSLLSFYIGRRFLTYRIASFCSIKKHQNLCNLFSKYGRLELLIAAITPVPFVSSCWLAGAFKIETKDFFLFGIFPRLLRISFILIIFFVSFLV
jgi:membrane protein YqaA with SNARE-associated domain